MIVRTRRLQRVLAEMQHALHRSDPRLVARFTIFSRLTSDEAIPPFERVRSRIGRGIVMVVPRGLQRRRQALRARSRLARWRLGAVLVAVVAFAGLSAFALVSTAGHAPVSCPPAAVRSHIEQDYAIAIRGYWAAPNCPAQAEPPKAGKTGMFISG
ncbi:MAG TPA: hypothetical protein VGL63_06670 [Streptosporangiaceae bacterium]|jgi:hypothetical protein